MSEETNVDFLTKELFLKKIADHAVPEIFKLVKKGANKNIGKIQNALEAGFKEYYDDIYNKVSKVKIIVNGNDPLDIRDIYTNITLNNSERKYFEDYDVIEDVLENNGKLIVSGTAGSGKSMFTKYAVLQSVRLSNNTLPVYFELRNLNSAQNNKDFSEILWADFKISSGFTEERFKEAAKKGIFIFIFDGMDEIDIGVRDRYESQVRRFAKEYSDCAYIMSSRPDESLASWSQFKILSVSPMTLEKVQGLIEKIPFNAAVKVQFLEALDIDLYNQHKSFLTVPLLASMMLLTYDHFANTPEKLHVFYSQVFEALFYRHDLKKEGRLERETFTKLKMDEFSSVFEYLSCSTYLENKLSFSRAELSTQISEALDVSLPTSSTVNAAAYLNDLLKTVCLMINEGVEIRFTHRSFQEYFTALFLANTRNMSVSKAIKAMSKRATLDNVLSLLYGLNKDLVEQEFILPELGKIVRELNDLNDGAVCEVYSYFIPNASCVPYGNVSDRTDDGVLRNYGVSSDGGMVEFEVTQPLRVFNFLQTYYPAYFEKFFNKKSKLARDGANRGVFFFAGEILDKNIMRGLRAGPYSMEDLKARLDRSAKSRKFASAVVETLNELKQDIEEKQNNKTSSLKRLLK